MIQGFGQEITEIPAFGHDITEVRAMGQLVWQKQSSIPDYLCFTALESGTFTLTIPAAVTATYLSYIEWSKDGRTWTHTDNTSEAVTIDVQVAQGDKVYWRGSGNSTAMGVTVGTQNSQFSSSARFDVSGNIMSMLFADDFDEQLVLPNVSYSFTALFRNCSKLISAENLLLPAMTLRVDCYRNLFIGCSNLVNGVKVLPAVQITGNCYLQMYANCSSLTEGTEIHATTAMPQCCYGMYTGCRSLTAPKPILFTNTAYYCCFQMYRNCTSLEVAPDLTPATLASNCYRQMFKGCTKLKYIKCLATDISATQCLLEWCDGVSSTGTFIQASGVEWPRGASGIPTGWVDVEKRTMPSGYKQVEYLLNPNLGAFNLQHVFDSANETIELQFVNTADGGQFLGTTNHGGYYGAIKVGKSGTANLSVQIGIGDTTTNTSVIGMTADAPMTFRYEGNANGFKFYTNGTLQKSYTGGWDVQHTITSMYVYSNTDGSTAPSTYPTWFGKCPFIGLKVWDGNSDIIIDFVPCIRESDGLAGFYDFARTTFYYSSNGNDFTAGEEI